MTPTPAPATTTTTTTVNTITPSSATTNCNLKLIRQRIKIKHYYYRHITCLKYCCLYIVFLHKSSYLNFKINAQIFYLYHFHVTISCK